MGSIIHQNHPSHIAIREYSQVFNVHPLLCLVAMVSKHTLRNEFAVGVQAVKNHICIA